MKASAGLGMIVFAAANAAVPALAQTAPAPQPQGETVGPRELRDFSLPGTTTPPATQPQPEPAPAPPATETPAQERPSTPTPGPSGRRAAIAPTPAERPQAQPTPEAPPILESQPLDPVPEVVSDEPLLSQPPVPPPATPPVAAPVPTPSRWTMVPWLLAALAGAIASGYLLWRRRSRAALAGVQELEAFIPAEPAPSPPPVAPAHPRMPASARAPSPAPPPARPTGAAPGGIVSTGLRPGLELELTPSRCIIDQEQAVIEFTVTARNTGNAPARDVRIEVAMINAGPAQDQEIGRFFDQPAGVGEPLEVIPPMRSIQLNSRVGMPLEQVRAFEAAGRKLFVPLLAFNALFRWSGGEGQTSLSYLVGREGEGEKMAPFRLDLGPRIFRNLGARPHHMQVRR